MAQKIKKVKTQNNQGKKMLVLCIMLVIMGGLIGLAYFVTQSKQEEINVVRINHAMTSGTVITEADIEPYPMLKSTYDTLGVVATESGDVTTRRQVIIPWDERDNLYGMYLTNYLRQGDYITILDVTNEVTMRNPWVANMTEDQEVYTMPFSTTDVNTRLVYPGTRLRVRLVVSVPADQAPALRRKIEEAQKNLDGKTVRESILLNTELPDTNDSEYESVEVAEVIMDSIQITDMLNSSGESIYDIYMALLKLPINQRMAYLSTALGDSDTALSFQSRVTPSSLCFVVDKESASILAEFENTKSATLKYTVLP